MMAMTTSNSTKVKAKRLDLMCLQFISVFSIMFEVVVITCCGPMALLQVGSRLECAERDCLCVAMARIP